MTGYLVMLQTNSNQPFIFSSPRLREQIGASFEITLLSRWVKEAACDMKLPSMSTSEEGKKALPASFWVSDSSGKVIVRFTESDGNPEKLARQLIREVTLRALTDAPGLDVTGVFIEASSNTVDAGDLNALDGVFLEYSLNRRPALARFPQFPFLDSTGSASTRVTHSRFRFFRTTGVRSQRRREKTRIGPCRFRRESSARGHVRRADCSSGKSSSARIQL